MKRLLGYMLLVILLALVSNVHARGVIIVNHDEWTLSNAGFARGDSDQFALNIGRLFTHDTTGNFLVYSSNFGLTESQLSSTMINAGHSWTISTSEDTTLSNLLHFDGIFLSHNPMDNAILSDYVNAGGSVYLAAGTSISAPAHAANTWNTFLNDFNLSYAPNHNGVVGTFGTTSDHPIFLDVQDLYYNNGNFVSELNPLDPNTDILEQINGNGMIAIYNPVPVPGALWLLGSGLIAFVGFRRKLKVG
jgi:hypothetical protein